MLPPPCPAVTFMESGSSTEPRGASLIVAATGALLAGLEVLQRRPCALRAGRRQRKRPADHGHHDEPARERGATVAAFEPAPVLAAEQCAAAADERTADEAADRAGGRRGDDPGDRRL